MKKEEYINKVLLHIKNKAYLATVKNELEGHISDRESYYIEIGYDNETATVKAMEHMGDADLLGEKMNRLHNDKGLKISSRTTAILGVAIFAIYAVFIDEYFNIGLSALCYAYAHNSAYLLVTVTFLVLMTVSYCCAVKTRQSRLMNACAYAAIVFDYQILLKVINALLPLVDFREAIEEIKAASSISAIYYNYAIYDFLFAALLLLCIIIIFIHGITAAFCSYEFKSFEKGKGNMTIINRFDSYRKFIITVSVIFSVICVVDSVLTIRMFI